MAKSNKIKIADSNIALLGSKVEKEVKAASAAGEPAWAKAGKVPGLQVWRVEQFKIREVKDNVGSFYTGDSYIVLSTYKKGDSDKLLYDLHFWLGQETSQDEAGTAAYKTAELDTLLNDEPIQHREVQGYESDLFLSYWKSGLRILEGGVESGFNQVKPQEYRPRLLWIKGRKKFVRVTEVPRKVSSINRGDVFLLDAGLTITQWVGSEAGLFEKQRARDICDSLRAERGGKPQINVVNENDKDVAEFYAQLEGNPADVQSAAVGGDDVAQAGVQAATKRLLRLSDESGVEELTVVAEGRVSKDLLVSDDVFVFDIGPEVFTWIGKKASANERAKALSYAQMYLAKYERPNYLPISKVMEGGDSTLFNSSFD